MVHFEEIKTSDNFKNKNEYLSYLSKNNISDDEKIDCLKNIERFNI